VGCVSQTTAMPYRVSRRDSHQKRIDVSFLLKCESLPQEYRLLLLEPALSHNSCLRDVAWIRPAYTLTKRGDVGATIPTVLARQ
jgi:hypothetical protein